MAVAQSKFLFDLDFSPGARVERPIAPSDHARQLAEAEAKAFRDGYAAAERDAIAEAARRSARAFEQIGDALDRLAHDLDGLESRLESETVEVAVAVGRKLAPALLAREPLAEIGALAGDCFRNLVAVPHVAVRVNADAVEAVREQLLAIAGARGFDGRLIVLGEPNIAPGDCRIEWADGGLVRDAAATSSAIAELVASYLESRATASRNLVETEPT